MDIVKFSKVGVTKPDESGRSFSKIGIPPKSDPSDRINSNSKSRETNLINQTGDFKNHNSTKRKPRKDPDFKRPHVLSTEHENIYQKQRTILSTIKSSVDSTPYNNKLNEISHCMDFVRSFTTKGVQGVVGFTVIKKELSKNPLVFKLSTDVNRSVEHEYEIMEYFNNMRKYCPHFSRSIGMINLPVSNDFVFDSYDSNLFSFDDETIPRNVLFMEYVNKLPFFRLCQDCNDKNIIISQILQVMIALEIGQQKKKLTHYDLHTANILMQMCEPNSVFVYKIKGKNYFIPTFGFFPMIIDMGISYSDVTIGKKMMSNTDNYDHGFQTTEFDYLNDVHHFLLTSFYYIEVDSEAYDFMSNKIKFIFRHLPVLRKSGWKMLPNDLCDIVIEKLKDECRYYNKYDLFSEYDKPSLELFNTLITLPIKNRTSDKSFYDCFPAFMDEYHKMIDIDDFSEHDVMFVLREIINSVNMCRELYKINPDRGVERFKFTVKDSISTVLKDNVFYDKIDYEKLLISAIVFGEKLESVYHELIEEHREFIDERYNRTVVESPIDMFIYISKNLTPHFNIDKNTVVYIWDTDREENKRITCEHLSEGNIKRINREFYSKKADLLLSML